MDEIDLRDGNGRHRAEDVQPRGYVSSHQTQLEHVARELGAMRLAADIIADERGGASVGDRAAAADISQRAGAAARVLRAIATGALVALVAVGLSVGGARPAAAAEAPQPDPVASGITYRVTLDRPVVALAVPFVTSRPVPGTRLHCGSLYVNDSPVGYGCSMHRAFTVTARLDAAALPVGKSALELVDEATGASVTATLQARRPSRFLRGAWTDLGNGDVWVSAPIVMYSPVAARWLPQQLAPVAVQELTRRGWRTRATLTSRNGLAAGIVHLGGGVRRVRVVRVEGATVTATTGATRTVVVTTEPLDVI